MKNLLFWVGAIALACISLPAVAQVVTLPRVTNAEGSSVPATGSVIISSNGAEKGIAANPLTVDTVAKSTATDRGASVGTTAVTLMASNTSRRGFAVQVQSTTASCYINGQATATADYHSLQIAAGALYVTESTHVGTGAISIICTGAATSVYSREY